MSRLPLRFEKSMLRRMVGWDYRARAIYQITIVLADRSGDTLGRLEVKGPEGWASVEAARAGREPYQPEAVEARVVPSALGLALADALAELPRRFPQVSVLASQLMPDHFHFIVFVREPIEKPLGALVRGVKAGAVKRWKEIYAAENSSARNYAENGGGRCVPAGSPAGVPAWAEGFQDTILFHEGQLANMFRYLADNPRRRAVKALWPGLFKVVDELAVPLSLGPGQPSAFSEKKAQLFAAAKHGSVLISPCVSDGERQIAREALAQGLPLVALRNKGFSKLEKPSGRHFGAVAMNRLCQWIVGEGAADVNYHGMKPENIDALARDAALLDKE